MNQKAFKPLSNSFYAALLDQREAIETKYRKMTPRSSVLFEEATRSMPGGLTRDSVMRRPYPAYLVSGAGSQVTDADDNQLTDYWFNATSLPLGHCHPAVLSAVERQIKKGTAFFGPGTAEAGLAEELLDRLPSAERVRFTNSGSEAVMIAVRLARGFTRRPIIAKFEGSYHGSYDDVAWSVGPKLSDSGPRHAPKAVAESLGLVSSKNILILPYNDLTASTSLLDCHKGEVAGLLVEPLANRMGFVLPERDFILGLKEYCDSNGILLIFDEVIAFRVGYHGAQGGLNVAPDITTLGKVVGGGFPVGAIAGRADVMEQMNTARSERVPHAGTFNGNPVTMEAGLATIQALTPDVVAAMNNLGDQLRSRLSELVSGLPLQVTGIGSLFKISASHEPITDYRSAVASVREWEELAALALWTEGCCAAPRLHGCLSAVSTQGDIDRFVNAFTRILDPEWRPS